MVKLPTVCKRPGGYTCIAYGSKGKGEDEHILSIEMASPELLQCSNHAPEFLRVWTEVPEYDVVKAARTYLGTNMIVPDEVRQILRKVAKMESEKVESKPKAEPAAKADLKKAAAPLPKNPKPAAKKAAPAPAAKGKAPAKKAAGGKAKFEDTAVIKFLKGHETKRFNEGSVRSQIWAKVKEGMTVGKLVTACAGFADRKVVLYNLGVLSDTVNQKHPGLSIK
jgi:hypothetical protein